MPVSLGPCSAIFIFSWRRLHHCLSSELQCFVCFYMFLSVFLYVLCVCSGLPACVRYVAMSCSDTSAFRSFAAGGSCFTWVLAYTPRGQLGLTGHAGKRCPCLLQ
ncbi:unnamed protein product [Ectocarpus sp. 12 AP-2014]